MVNVNGVNVNLVNAAPKRVAAGWLHSSTLYHAETGSRIGVVEAIWSRKSGGTMKDRWARLGTWADGHSIPNGNINDLVARWALLMPAPATTRGVCPRCYMETKPGEQLYGDGSCWPQCLGARKEVV